MSVPVEVRGQPQQSFLGLHFFLRQGSWPGASRLDRLVSEPQGSLPLPPQLWDHKQALPHLPVIFHMEVLGIKLRSL